MKLVDFIQADARLGWAIQIIQNILSLCGNIPLQMFDLDRWPQGFNLLESMGLPDEGIDFFYDSELEDWPRPEKGVPRETIDQMKRFEVTHHSFHLPLWADMKRKRTELWAYEYLYFHDLFQRVPVGDFNISMEEVLSKRFSYVFCRLALERKNWFLVAGPVINTGADEIKPDERLFVENVEPLIDANLYKKGDVACEDSRDNTTGEMVSKKTVKPLIDADLAKSKGEEFIDFSERKKTLTVLSSLRKGWDTAGFQEVFSVIRKAAETVLNTEWPEGCLLKNSDCRRLAIYVYGLHSETINYVLDRVGPENLEIIRFPLHPHREERLVLDAIFSGEEWALTTRRLSPGEECKRPYASLKQRYKRVGFFRKDDLHEYTNRIPSIFNILEKQIDSFEISNAQERITLFLQRFRRENGLLTAYEGKNLLREICDGICLEVAMLFSAEVSRIYLYQYDEEKLKWWGSFSHGIKDTVLLKIEKIEKGTEDREKSIVHRVIDRGGHHFCRAMIQNPDGSTGFDPEDEPFLLDEGNPFHSAIAVPLTINGRTLGVLEILGCSPYQFRWENALGLNRISEFISTLIYEALIFQTLSELNQKFFVPTMDDHAKYCYICEKMKDLFMCYAAALWKTDEEKPGHFVAVGWSDKRYDLETSYRAGKPIYDDKSDPISIYHFGVKRGLKDTSYKTIPKGDWIGIPDWARSYPHRHWILDEKVEAVTLVLARGSKGEQEGPSNEVLLSLYFRGKGEGLQNPAWENTIKFFSKHINVLIETLRSQHEWENRIRNIIQHEMKTKVDSIYQQASQIYQYLPEVLPPDTLTSLKIGQKGGKSKLNILLENLRVNTMAFHKFIDVLKNPAIFKEIMNDRRSFMIWLYLQVSGDKTDRKDYYRIETINFRHLFNDIFSPTLDRRNEKGLQFGYDDFGIEEGPFLNINPVALTIIISNLVDNAIKYALSGTKVNVEYKTSEYGFDFRISNTGECLKVEGEDLLIFQERYRGSNQTGDGEGIGLHVARIMCELFEGGITLDLSKDNQGKCVFSFNVHFPNKIIAHREIECV